MKILLLHADHFRFHVTGETAISKGLEPLAESDRTGAMEQVLVCMIAVEKGDGEDPGAMAQKALVVIRDQCAQIRETRLMLYPYAHLSGNLESPRAAVAVLDGLTTLCRQDPAFSEVGRAPFGWYKGFDIQVKGHPLSEAVRSLEPGAGSGPAESSALKNESRKKSTWIILTPAGEEFPAESFNYAQHRGLEQFYRYETAGSRLSEEPPPHIRLMQEHELVDYEPGSDAGNFRWYPKGYLIKKLLEDQVSEQLHKLGAMRVETPIMYDRNHPALSKYLDKFPARQYQLQSDKGSYFLRFAACFGQYLMKRDMNISYRHLPLRLYELTHYSFRREQSGELTGLKRLRAFTMPDMHTLCRDIEQAVGEFLTHVDLSLTWAADLHYQSEIGLRAVADFYHANRDYAVQVARKAGRPILLELWERRYFYFVTKFEINVVDSQGKSSALSTVQIDVENPKDFGITFVGPDGQDHTPLMLHTSLSGSIDRNLYAILEQQAIGMTKGSRGSFPFWLAPTQVRLIPIKPEEHTDFCLELASRIAARVDVDERGESLNRRIRAAEKEWVPLIVVVGRDEMDSGQLPIRVREDKSNRTFSVDDLNAFIRERMVGKVTAPLSLPQRLSLRPIFRG
ncbi:MAG: threonine--tRNA ligase [Magnetococcus sp. DMHC-1]|nr:threonine--tRNA ligase [Magnetococcales bacterium]